MKRLVKNSKNAIDNSAPAGSVTTQDKTIVLTELKLIVLAPSTSPIPITAPTYVWVVDTGISNWLAITTVSAAANWAEKPLLGVSLTIFSPMVFITL